MRELWTKFTKDCPSEILGERTRPCRKLLQRVHQQMKNADLRFIPWKLVLSEAGWEMSSVCLAVRGSACVVLAGGFMGGRGLVPLGGGKRIGEAACGALLRSGGFRVGAAIGDNCGSGGPGGAAEARLHFGQALTDVVDGSPLLSNLLQSRPKLQKATWQPKQKRSGAA